MHSIGQEYHLLEVILFLISAVFLTLGVQYAVAKKRRLKNPVEAEGKVLQNVDKEVAPGKFRSQPIVEFKTIDNRREVVTLNVSHKNMLPIHSKIKIVYNANNPQEAIERKYFDQKVAPLLFISLGIFFLLILILQMSHQVDLYEVALALG